MSRDHLFIPVGKPAQAVIINLAQRAKLITDLKASVAKLESDKPKPVDLTSEAKAFLIHQDQAAIAANMKRLSARVGVKDMVAFVKGLVEQAENEG